MKNSFFKGAALLAATGAFCKAIGALYRIPLANLIGADGMANYQMAYPVYALLLVASTGGIPSAVSRIVSGGERRGARAMTSSAVLLFTAAGTALFGALFLARYAVAALTGLPQAGAAIGAIAPSLAFAAGTAVLRGYFQGLGDMRPSAVSQVIEQTVKLCAGLYFAWRMSPMGAKYGAAGALLGVSAAEAVSFAVLLALYLKKGRGAAPYAMSSRPLLRRLVKTALPITAAACMVPVEGVIDSLTAVNLMTGAGISAAKAAGMYGIFSGFVCPLANMPGAVTMAVATSLLPAVSSAFAAGDAVACSRRAKAGIRLCLLASLPMAAALFAAGREMLAFLYPSLKAAELSFAAGLLKIDALTVVLLALIQSSSAVLHATGHTLVPFFSLAVGAALKAAAGVILIPRIGVAGAAAGSVVCYAVAAAADLFFAARHARLKLFADGSAGAFPAAAGMAAALFFLRRFAVSLVSLGAVLLAGAAFYAILLLVTGAVGRDDIALIRKGSFFNDKHNWHGNGRTGLPHPRRHRGGAAGGAARAANRHG